jgi:hypothetical protein
VRISKGRRSGVCLRVCELTPHCTGPPCLPPTTHTLVTLVPRSTVTPAPSHPYPPHSPVLAPSSPLRPSWRENKSFCESVVGSGARRAREMSHDFCSSCLPSSVQLSLRPNSGALLAHTTAWLTTQSQLELGVVPFESSPRWLQDPPRIHSRCRPRLPPIYVTSQHCCWTHTRTRTKWEKRFLDPAFARHCMPSFSSIMMQFGDPAPTVCLRNA